MEPFANPDDETMRAMLERARRVAVVGLSPKPHRDSNRVARYLQDRGYEIAPVYPREDVILGRPVFRRAQDVPAPVDIVDVFRRSEHLSAAADDAIAAGALGLWFQIGCVDHEAAARARDAGLTVVMDRCLMVEHARLLGSEWSRP